LWLEFIKHFGPTLVHINQNVAWVAYVKDFMFINNINGCQPQAIGVILAWESMKNMNTIIFKLEIRWAMTSFMFLWWDSKGYVV